jgi:hypothetical protein
MEDHRCTDEPWEDQVPTQAEGEEELGNGERAVLWAETKHFDPPELSGEGIVAVRVQNALGQPRGSARIVERAVVVAVRADGLELIRCLVDPCIVCDGAGGKGSRITDDHHVLDSRLLGHRFQRFGEQRVVHEQDSSVRVDENVSKLTRREQGVHTHCDGTDFEAGEERDRPLGRVQAQNRDAVTAPHPHFE